MGTAHAPIQSAPDPVRSVYGYVGDQIAALVPQFGLQPLRPPIMRAYELICGESLAFPLGSRPADYSRINHDGTPFQFSVTVGSPLRSLQFLGEAGRPGLPGAERMRVSRECIAAVATSLQADEALSAVTNLLDVMAPDTHPILLADPGGAFWIGAGFAPARTPRMKIYINARWGRERDRWARLERFASFFGMVEPWQRLKSRLEGSLEPLGTALTLGAGKPPTGRIYLSAFGQRIAYYEELARSICGDSLGYMLQRYARCMLAQDYRYPTQSAVCSFGLGSEIDFKFELCAHCLFVSDIEAAFRLQSWFVEVNQDPADYLHVLDVLSEGYLSNGAPDLHCYVGLGLKQGAIYTTVYFKPRLVASHGR